MKSIPHRRALRDNDGGFTLVEVMVAMTLFVIGLIGLAGAFAGALDTTSDNRSRTVAANVAASDIDEARSLDYPLLINKQYTKTVDGRDYKVFRSVSPVFATGPGDGCTSSTTRAQTYKRVSTRVEFPFKESVQPIRSDTVVSAPVYDPSSTVGAAGVRVIDRMGQPLEAVTVALGATNYLTNEAGCAFVDGLVAGNYTFSVSRVGYVTSSGASSTSAVLGVNAGQITSQTFQLDLAARIDIMTTQAAAPGLYPLPTGLTVKLDSPSRSVSTATRLLAKPAVVGASASWTVFPFSEGYETYLGGCGTVRGVMSDRGATSVQTLPVVPVDVTVSGTSLAGKAVQAIWAGSAGSCLGGTVETLTTSTSLAAGTNPNTAVLKLALPEGQWTLRVVGKTGTSPTVNTSAAPPVGTALSLSWSVS